MRRQSEDTLKSWYGSQSRKPLVIRGARQVGKSTLARNVAEDLGVPIWEINLERHPDLDATFARFDVPAIIRELSLATNRKGIGTGPGILFLDEIQAAPHALAALRYFHEDRPDIALIAAGSLLEFTLAKTTFSIPVGRIEYHWLGPMTFTEFLDAMREEALAEFIASYSLGSPIPAIAHERLLTMLRDYMLIGGMPEAVYRFSLSGDPLEAIDAHRSILETYKDDFSKYASGAELEKLRRVYELLPSNIAEKIRYNRFHPDWKAQDIRKCLELLQRAGIAAAAVHSEGNGVPLGANEDPTVSKLFHLDIGLVGTATGMGIGKIEEFRTGRFINEGTRAEQFTAQHLLQSGPRNRKPALHYWQREGKGTNAEVDFLTQIGNSVLPIEVKSGAAGSLRSLHQFMLKHPLGTALRLDLNPPSFQEVTTEVMTAKGKESVRYRLWNFPLYLAERAVAMMENAAL